MPPVLRYKSNGLHDYLVTMNPITSPPQGAQIWEKPYSLSQSVPTSVSISI